MSSTSPNQSRLASWLHRVVLVLCVVALLEGQWLGLQSYAWLKMVWDRSETMGWSLAVQDVASGEHPCELCSFVQAGREQKDQEMLLSERFGQQPMTIMRLVKVQPAVLLGEMAFPIAREANHERLDSPPVPPPREVA